MATLKKYNLKGQEIGTVEVSDALANAEVNGQLIKDYIVALRANARQWSANTKTRSEVCHSTKKPHPQKGGGRARQGTLAAPQYKGGGRVHAPRPKFDQHVRINRKERLAAIRCLLGEKIRTNKVKIIESYDLEAPKTKIVASFLETAGVKGRSLFLGEGNYVDIGTDGLPHYISVQTTQYDNFILSLRNIPRTEFSLAKNINGYDVLVAGELILTEAALKEISDWLL